MREFLTSQVKNGGGIPKTDQLQTVYLPDLYKQEKEKLINSFVDKKVALIFDEMTDDEGRYVLNILIAPLEFDDKDRVLAYLVDTVFLQATNHSSVGQAVGKTVQDYNISFDNVWIVDTDNAAYMKKCFNTILSGLFQNAVHITCLAHIMNIIGESFRKPFVEINAYVRAFNAQFFNAGSRKARFLNFIKSKDKNAPMVPNPCATRWNSWFDTVKYHEKYFKYMTEYIQLEKEQCGKNPPDSVTSIHDILTGPERQQSVERQIKIISEVCEPILSTLDMFQSRIPVTLHAYERFEELQLYFATFKQMTVDAFKHHFVDAEDVSLSKRLEIINMAKVAFQDCQDKLEKYMRPDDGQPGIQFLKASRLFNPRNCDLISKNMEQYTSIPTFAEIPSAEFDLYLNLLAPDALKSTEGVVNPHLFWKGVEDRVPNLSRLAQLIICAVTNSADAERSNSIYNLILDSRRRKLLPESLRMMVFLYYNNLVTSGVSKY